MSAQELRRVPWQEPVGDRDLHTETIPLAAARLCVECESVFHLAAEDCPSCGCSASLRLALSLGVLGRGPLLRLVGSSS